MTRQYHRFLSLTHPLSFVALILTIFAVTRSSAQDGVDPNAQGACTGSSPCVPTYHNDNNRDGVQNNEGQLSPSLFNATNQSASNFGLLGATPTSGAGVLDGLVYAQPLYLSGVAMYNNTDTPNCPVSGNPYNLLLVATQNNSIYAYTYTYNQTVSPYTFSITLCWQLNLNIASASENAIQWTNLPVDPSTGNPCNNIIPQSGTTSTPVIDINSTPPVMYVVTAHQIPQTGGGFNYDYRLHAILLDRGKEVSTGYFDLSTALPAGVTAATENQRPGLALYRASGSSKAYIDIGFGSYCDATPYSGYVASVTATYGGGTVTFAKNGTNWVFDTENGVTSQNGGVWMSGAAPALDSNGNVYVAVGNGHWNGTGSSRTSNFGESVVKLANITSGLKAVDYYTPNDYSSLDLGNATVCSANSSGSCPSANVLNLNNGAGAGDIDLGSGGVTLISPVGITSPICGSNPELVAGGKEGVIYGVCYSNQTGSTLQTIMGGLDGCGYSCSSPGSNQTNTACTQLPTSNGIAQCFQGVNAGENSSGTGVILQSPGIHGTEAFWAGTTASPLNYLYVGGVGTSSSQTRITAYLASTANGAFGTQGWLDNQPTDWTYPGPVPAISWNGSTSGSGLLWAIDDGSPNYGTWNGSGTAGTSTAAKPAVLAVYQAVPATVNGTTELENIWKSSISNANAGPGAVKFAVPTVANGLVFVSGGASGYAQARRA